MIDRIKIYIMAIMIGLFLRIVAREWKRSIKDLNKALDIYENKQ